MKKNFVIILTFLFAISARISLFLADRSLWLDEAALALNIMDKGFLELLGPLIYNQSAPWGFLEITKLLTVFFGYSENVLRLVPLFSGTGAVFAFYFLFKAVFKEDSPAQKVLIALSVLFVSFSYPLLYYSIEFKPYITDVLATILIFLAWLKYLKPTGSGLDTKKEIVLALVLSIFPLFSFGSIFPLCAVLGLSILQKRKILPAILAFSLVLNYIFVFKGISPETRLYQYWTPYFINFSPAKILPVTIDIFRLYFYPNKLILPAFILFFAGLVLSFKKDREVFKFALITIFGGYLASFLNIYPLYDRLSLFLYPVFLIIILYPAYSITLKSPDKRVSRWISIPVCIIFSLFFISSIFQNTLNPDYYRREEMKPAIKELKHRLKDERIISYTGSHLAFRYYIRLFGLANRAETCTQKENCLKKIENFCAKTSCYIISASEIERERKLLELGSFAENHNGGLVFYKHGGALFRIDLKKQP